MSDSTTHHGPMLRRVLQHRTALYAYIFACVRKHSEADDILQDVFVAAVESIGQIKDEAGVLPWLREIARRRILAHGRSSRRELAVDPALLSCFDLAAQKMEAAQPSSGLKVALMECLDDLPDESRRVLIERYGADTPEISDIAKRAGRSVQGVYALLKRAKLLVRDCVQRRMSQNRREAPA